MSPDSMDDLEISLRLRTQQDARKQAEADPCADPSLYTPWGILGPQDYSKKDIRSDQ